MPTYKIGSGLPDLPAGQEDKEAALLKPIYMSMNALARRVSEATGNVVYSQTEMAAISQLTPLTSALEQIIHIKASEDLTYGQLVTLSIADGKIVAAPADATDGTKPALAIVDSPLGITSGQFGPAIFLFGRCAGVSGSVFGAQYYLGLDGQMQLLRPDLPGALVQPVALGLGSAGVFLSISSVGNTLPGGTNGGTP